MNQIFYPIYIFLFIYREKIRNFNKKNYSINFKKKKKHIFKTLNTKKKKIIQLIFFSLSLIFKKKKNSFFFLIFVVWLILPVIICLSKRLNHACLSIT